MAKRVIEIRPTAKQMKFLRMKTRYCGYGGARGGGKSWVLRVKACLLANRYGAPDEYSEGIKICIVRRTLVDVRNNHIIPMKIMLRGMAKFNQAERTFYLANGATIHFEYYDSEADANHFQGVEYDIIFVDEATQMEEEWLKIIAASCRGANNFPHRVYFTCNPGGPGHQFIKRIFIDRIYKDDEDPADYSFVQALVTDNTVLMEMDQTYIGFLKNLPPKLRKAWLEGDWNIAEGIYFDDFVNDPEHYDDGLWTHVINPVKIRKHWTIYRGFDWGSYRPFSVGWYAVDEFGTMIRFYELYGVQKSGQESIANMGVKWPDEKIFRKIYEIEHSHPDLVGREIIGVADPSIWKQGGGISIAETASQCGVYFEPGDNTRIPGWRQCRYRLQFDEGGKPRFYVTTNCREFIRTIPTLMHDPHDNEDLDSDGEDHAADEWRYVVNRIPIKPIIEEPEYVPAWGDDPLNMIRRTK